MTLDDIAGYEAKERNPVCAPYRAYRVCSMPPPTSGGVTLLQILSALERFESQELQPQSVSQIHRVAEAERLAYADRALYLADPDFVDVPVAGLLDRDYLLMRRTLTDPARAMPSVEAGRPKGALDFAPHVSPEFQGTTHFSIVDAEGNAVSMTASIEFAFGSQLMAGGFLLNNELTDFSFEPARDGKPIANAVAPGKRPRSSMTPVIIFDADGKPWATLGSPGGESIIGYVAQSVVDLIDGQVDIQSAFDAPRFMRRLGPLEFEEGTPLAGRAAEFEAMGHAVTAARFNSGLHGIRIFADHLEGGADPRREGIAAGD
jgi:gamma-glutamyltranspeptidase/glutathione hydrolase